MQLVWVVLILTADLSVISGQDCSGTYDTLPDVERRARNYVLAANEAYVSDDLLDSKWYKVNNYNMPTNYSNLDLGMCGTYFPIWMNGTIPGSGDGRVTRNACTISFYDSCSPKKTIEIINCTTFMLYKLGPTSQSSGYCFDSLKTDAVPGEAPSYKPDSATVKPDLYFTNETNPYKPTRGFRKPRLQFWCDYPTIPNDSFFYWITWYINDVFFKQEDPQPYTSRHKTNLYEDELIKRNYKLGITIQCVVRASKSVSGLLGNRTVSPGYWMGVQVITSSVTVQQGKTGTVQLRATFPFGCRSAFNVKDPDCFLSVQMYDPYDKYECTSTSISVEASSRCGVKLPGLTYTELLLGINYTNVITNMTITTKDVNDYNPGRNRFVLKLVTGSADIVNDIATGSYLTDINVVVNNTPSWYGKQCYAHIDPHMRTFDGLYYENQNVGVFVLYRHQTNNQEVQMWTKTCWAGHIFCACAVAVRAGGDLFIMSICNTPKLIKFVSCYDSILEVTQINPNLYKVLMPLGAVVNIAILYDVYLNIDIYPTVKDDKKTLGLCGVLNDNTGDDFKMPSGQQTSNNNEFSLSWRIPVENSFFSPANFKPAVWDADSYLCVCPAALNTTTPPATASGDKLTPLCSASIYLSCTKKVTLLGTPYQCEVRTKRSETTITKEVERLLVKQIKVTDPGFDGHRVEKRQTRTYTFEEAFALCSSIFDANCTTTAFEGSLPESTVIFKNGSLSNCAQDVIYIGDTSLANVHCESYRSAVNEEINRNSTYREENPDVVKSFLSRACISNCNFHGNCTNGSCVCHASYIGEDCSMSLNDSPDVDDTFNGGICKREIEDCCGDKPIYGTGFVQGITKLKSERIQRYADGTEVVIETIVSNIPVRNKYEGTMYLPCNARELRSSDARNIIQTFVSGVRVSLTNDGRTYGTPQTYYIYDSRCQVVVNVTNGYTFYLVNGTCFIDDLCYNDGNQNPSDSCKSCKSSFDPYSWTDECSNIKLNPASSSDNLVLIVASVVSSVVFVALVVVITIVIFKRCFKKERTLEPENERNAPVNAPWYEREPIFKNQPPLEHRPRSARDVSLKVSL